MSSGRRARAVRALPARAGVAAAVVAVLALAGCERGEPGRSGGPGAGPQAGAATVTRVVDGDTIHVRLGSGGGGGGADEKVRLIGIDTPETKGRGGVRECFGAEAASRLQALLPPGTPVRLVRDVEPRDRYGRLLAYVYRGADGLFVNLALAREGYATVLTYPPNVAHAGDLGAAVREARHSQRGLWRRCGGPDTPEG